MMSTLLALALAVQGRDTAPPGPRASAPPPGRACVVEIDSVGGDYREVSLGSGLKNSFAGGGVLAHCRGTGSRVSADSFAHYGGPDRLDLVGNVVIRDTAFALDATTASYFLRDERLEAHRNVVAVNRRTGSVLRGPNVTYYRTVPGVRDTTEMRASGRPTIEYRSPPSSPQPDQPDEPFVIVADRVRFKGDDRFWGGGQVTIDRSDFLARGDSVMMDETAGVALLLGKPRLEGKGASPYTLVGRRIELDLDAREVRRAKALGAGETTASDWRLTADTIHMDVEQRKVQQVFAWGDASRPHVVSAASTVQSDSLALDTPDQVLTELRAFDRAHATSARDSTADSTVGHDWIDGDTIVATFDQVADTAGKSRSELRSLLASGHARSLMHLKKRGEIPCWSRNYSRGRQIAVTMAEAEVEEVVVSGQADGAQLECLAARPAPDSAAADSARTPAPLPRRTP